jgi:hypothetical protein
MEKLAIIVGVILIIAVLIAGYLAYIVTEDHPADDTTNDGLGRSLVQAPRIIRIINLGLTFWPGWRWYTVDFVVFWGGIWGGYELIRWSLKKNTSSKED